MASKQMNIENCQVTYGSEKVGGGQPCSLHRFKQIQGTWGCLWNVAFVFFFRGDPERLCTFRCLVPTYIGKDLSKRKCSGKDPEFYFHFSSWWKWYWRSMCTSMSDETPKPSWTPCWQKFGVKNQIVKISQRKSLVVFNLVKWFSLTRREEHPWNFKSLVLFLESWYPCLFFFQKLTIGQQKGVHHCGTCSYLVRDSFF